MQNFLKTIKNADATLIVSPINRRYFTKFNSSAGMLLITKDKNYFLTDFRYIVDANAQIKNCEIIMIETGKGYYDIINGILAEQKIETLGVEFDRLTVAEFNTFKEKLPVNFVDISREILLARNIKTDDEIAKMRIAESIGDKAFTDILNFIKPGITEKEIANKIMSLMNEHGGDGISFDPIIASGKNGASPHAKPTDKKVEIGEFITMDFGCTYQGYCSDMTRTIALGTPTAEMKKVYDLVLEAQLLGVSIAKANIKGSEIHNAVSDFFKKHDVYDNFGHGFGHGIGLEVHEGFGAGGKSEDLLLENMIISAEPGLYFEGFCGVRIEDILVLKKDGNENLTNSKKELIIL